VNAAIGTKRKRGADRLLRRGGPDADHNDLARLRLLLETHGLLDSDLVERVHREFDAGRLDRGLALLDADFDVVVDDALDTHKDFHGHPI